MDVAITKPYFLMSLNEGKKSSFIFYFQKSKVLILIIAEYLLTFIVCKIFMDILMILWNNIKERKLSKIRQILSKLSRMKIKWGLTVPSSAQM